MERDIGPRKTKDLVVERANLEDAPAIKHMVDAAYTKYIERIGRPPAPMTADYSYLISTEHVSVLRVSGQVVGSIILIRDHDSIQIENVVVDPSAQGHGYGRVLMEYAEDRAREEGLRAVTMYTNEKMWENVALYAKLGYVEVGKRMEHGFNRVFFRKELV